MAITHNLSDPSNNLSGFDPVAGESDGTTFGRTWLMWKIFDALRTFDTRVTLITASSPTPTFLQGEVGTIVSEPAKSASSANQTISFYFNDDPGLTESTPTAIVYQWTTQADIASNVSLFSWILKFAKSGSATYAPSATNIYGQFDAATTAYSNVNTVTLGFTSGSTTVMANIPKIIFYKTNQLIGIFSIRKDTGVIAGGGYFVRPTWTGVLNTSGTPDEGLNISLAVWFFNNGGQVVFEGVNNLQLGTYVTANGNNDVIKLGGLMPSSTFSISGVVYLISGVIRIAVSYPTLYKLVSDELEGVIYAHASALTADPGTISVYNSKYYLNLGSIGDSIHKHALELEAV